MATSFIGLTVEIQLLDGQFIRGPISSVDASSGSLSVYNAYNSSQVQVNRSQIRDLQLITSQQQQGAWNSNPSTTSTAGQTTQSKPPSQSQPLPPSDRAILSSRATSDNSKSSTTSISNQGQPQPQSQSQSKSSQPVPASQSWIGSSDPNPSATSTPNSPKLSRRERKKLWEETNRRTNNASSGANEPQRHQKDQNQNLVQKHILVNPKGKSKANQGNEQSNQATVLAPAPVSGGFEEDFDFSAGLNNFDKKAIWEEIRISDQSDKAALLVSHNRQAQVPRSNSSSPSPQFQHQKKQLTKDGRNGQIKLAPDENVLSPEPEPAKLIEVNEEAVKSSGKPQKDPKDHMRSNGKQSQVAEKPRDEANIGSDEAEEGEEEEEEDEFLEALSSPSPAFASSSMQRNGSGVSLSHKKPSTHHHGSVLQVPRVSSHNIDHLQKVPQPDFSQKATSNKDPRPRDSDSKTTNDSSDRNSKTSSLSPEPCSSSAAPRSQTLLCEIKDLKEKLSLLEALSGIELQENASLRSANAEPGSKIYDCRLNDYQFSLACSFGSSNAGSGGLERVRYLPPKSELSVTTESDGHGSAVNGANQAEILKKLPGHYSKEIGLRPENVGVFVQRLRDCLKS